MVVGLEVVQGLCLLWENVTKIVGWKEVICVLDGSVSIFERKKGFSDVLHSLGVSGHRKA